MVVCENTVYSEKYLVELLTHEMIHAYDHCRAFVNWRDCEQHACSEIRAASLSGDCRFFNEVGRGNFGLVGHHQVCVKRRALKSVLINPNCTKDQAEAAVESAFARCYKDTMPFDRMPR